MENKPKYTLKNEGYITSTAILKLHFSSGIEGLDREFEAIRNYQNTVEQLSKEITTAEMNYDLNRAANIKYEQIPGLVNEIEIIKSRIREKLQHAMSKLIKGV